MVGRLRSSEGRKKGTHRTSVSFPADLHRELKQIAKQKKVSLAWVIRDAAENYVDDRWPLLVQKGSQ